MEEPGLLRSQREHRAARRTRSLILAATVLSAATSEMPEKTAQTSRLIARTLPRGRGMSVLWHCQKARHSSPTHVHGIEDDLCSQHTPGTLTPDLVWIDRRRQRQEVDEQAREVDRHHTADEADQRLVPQTDQTRRPRLDARHAALRSESSPTRQTSRRKTH